MMEFKTKKIDTERNYILFINSMIFSSQCCPSCRYTILFYKLQVTTTCASCDFIHINPYKIKLSMDVIRNHDHISQVK